MLGFHALEIVFCSAEQEVFAADAASQLFAVSQPHQPNQVNCHK